jgi:transcriptional regulator with XRE-family HTH domain
MPKSSKKIGIVSAAKAPVDAMTAGRKREVIAQFTDDVLSKLTGAFFDVCKLERWTKRDLSAISGIDETAIGHILAGRRKNLTVETIALLTRAMGNRPELVLHDTRPVGNQPPARKTVFDAFAAPEQNQARASALNFHHDEDVQKPTSSALGLAHLKPNAAENFR